MGFQQRDSQDSQNLNTDGFCRIPVVSVQAAISTEIYPNAAIMLNYNDDDYSHGYAQTKEAFRALTKDDMLQPFISDDIFRSSIVSAVDFSSNLYVFDIRYQQIFTASQPSKVELNFDGVVPNVINGYALVLMNKLVSISSDGHRHYDLIEV